MIEQTQTVAAQSAIHPMQYRAILAPGLTPPELPAGDIAAVKKLEARIRELERELEERSLSLEAGLLAARAEACEAGRSTERNENAVRLGSLAQALAGGLEEFRGERDRYLAEVEREVVRLALAIAARILHREAQMDPLLLSGAVRVALGQLSQTTEVQLKVPASEHEMWSEMLRLMPNLPLRPELVIDGTLQTGQCLIETPLGSIDLGVRSQLAEIERGFFDLLEHRQARERMGQADQHSHRKKDRSAEPAAHESAP